MDVRDYSIVLAPYLESVVRGRRVAVLGDSSSDLGASLLQRGARLVHVYDSDAARAATSASAHGPSRTLVIAALPEGEMPVRDGAFDVVLVPDLSSFSQIDSVVARARRLVDSRGYAVFGSPNPDNLPQGYGRTPLSYYELYDAVALQFPEVRMFGQAPFSGVLIADFALEGEPNVVVDTSLIERGAEEPGWFLALGTSAPRRLEQYAIIQVPTSSTDKDKSKELSSPDSSVPFVAATRGGSRQPSAVPSLSEPENKTRGTSAQNDAAHVRDDRIEQLKKELEKERKRAGDNHVRAGHLENQIRDLQEELRRQRQRAFDLSTELEEEKKKRTKTELELNILRKGSGMAEPATKSEDGSRAEEVRRSLEQARKELSEYREKLRAVQAELDTARQREREAVARAEALADELEDLKVVHQQAVSNVKQLQQQAESRARHIEQLDERIVRLEAEQQQIDVLRRRVAELEKQKEEAERQAEQLQRQGGANPELQQRIAQLEKERDEAQRRAEQALRAEAELSELRQQVADLEKERNEARREAQSTRQQFDKEWKWIEKRLEERGRLIASLRDELEQSKQVAVELIARLERQQGASDEQLGIWKQRAEQLSSVNAKCKADLVAERWRSAQLEVQLEKERKVRPDSASSESSSQRELELEKALQEAHRELVALREALASIKGEEAEQSSG